MKYKVVIVEDEFIVAEDLKQILIKHGHETVGIALDYQEAILLLSEQSPEVVFVDIHLGKGKNGIELASIITEKYQLPILFITSFSDDQTVEKIKRLQPIGYLVKPFNEKNVVMALEIGMINRQKENFRANEQVASQDFFFVKDQRMMKKVKHEDILFLESDDNYTFIHTTTSRHIVYLPLKELLSKLPPNFVRVHRSYIINLKYITGMKANELFISDITSIPVGRSYKQSLKNRLNFLS